eukprot:TRINITY_DN6312_c0_g4_i1.p1 TRINITY_DN6312_c0_g4~~TRINITY_DN6312_c0_g4_i1.p1  ORF type:complete len:541 (+),score=127.61 TRINITY_DN6312_c0_g4_i1:79-1701(+)
MGTDVDVDGCCREHGAPLMYQCVAEGCGANLLCRECLGTGQHVGHPWAAVEALQPNLLGYVEQEVERLAAERGAARQDLQHLLKYHSKDRISQQMHYTTAQVAREFDMLHAYLDRKERTVVADLDALPAAGRAAYKLNALTDNTRAMLADVAKAQSLLFNVGAACQAEGTRAAHAVDLTTGPVHAALQSTLDELHAKAVAEVKADVRAARAGLTARHAAVREEIAAAAATKLAASTEETASLVRYIHCTDALLERLKATALMKERAEAQRVALDVQRHKAAVEQHVRPQPKVYAGIILRDTVRAVQALMDERYALTVERTLPRPTLVTPPRRPSVPSSTASYDDCADFDSVSQCDDGDDTASTAGLSDTPEMQALPAAPAPTAVTAAITACYQLERAACINDSGDCEARYMKCRVPGCHGSGCSQCISTCARCSTSPVCRSCIAPCGRCGMASCAACERACGACGGTACTACVGKCGDCEAVLCTGCSVECIECGERGCRACVRECRDCHKPVCSKCKDRYYNWSRMSNAACYPRHSVPS